MDSKLTIAPRIWNHLDYSLDFETNMSWAPWRGICFKRVPFIKIKALQINPGLYLTTFPHFPLQHIPCYPNTLFTLFVFKIHKMYLSLFHIKKTSFEVNIFIIYFTKSILSAYV